MTFFGDGAKLSAVEVGCREHSRAIDVKDYMTKKETINLPIGTKVFCTVFAVRGWYTVTAIRPRDGYIKISGFNTWNPPHNFELVDKHGKPYEN